MFQTFGWIKDELGFKVNKAILLRFVGMVDVSRWVVFENLDVDEQKKAQVRAKDAYDALDADGKKSVGEFKALESGDLVWVERKIPHYDVVCSHYFGSGEQVWEHGVKAYTLDLKNTSYVRRMTQVQFIDMESGNAVVLGGFEIVPPKNPDDLRRLWDNRQVDAYVSPKDKVNLMWLLVGGLVGSFGTYLALSLTGALV